MRILFSTLAALAISAPAMASDGFSLGAGFDYSTGNYGNAAATQILYVPVTGQYESGDLTLRLTVPYISVSGPDGVIMGFGRVPITNAANAPAFGRSKAGARGAGAGAAGAGGTVTSTNSGLGDIIASAGYTVYAAGALLLDAVGKVKFGTADPDKGLGTGKNDYFAQLDGYYVLVKDSTLMATIGYEVVGAPVGITTNNVPYGMLGFNQKTSESSNIGIMYNQVNSVAPTVAAQRDVTVYASRKFSPSLKVQIHLLKGMSTSSPDYGGGLTFTGYF